jgi:hypothetical protein
MTGSAPMRREKDSKKLTAHGFASLMKSRFHGRLPRGEAFVWLPGRGREEM